MKTKLLMATCLVIAAMHSSRAFAEEPGGGGVTVGITSSTLRGYVETSGSWQQGQTSLTFNQWVRKVRLWLRLRGH